jgi:hypothetical protein
MDDDRGLDRLIRAAGDAFDPSPDLPERIGQRVRQRQARRRIAVSLGAVLLVTAIVGVGLRLAVQDGPGDELRTASDDPTTGPTTTTTTTVPGPAGSSLSDATTTTTVPAPRMVPDGGSPTIYALQGSPSDPEDPAKLVEIDLTTGQVVDDEVIPLDGMMQVEPSGDERWWVSRYAQPCGNFTWEAHPVGAGGLAVPPSVDLAVSPDGGFVATLRADPLDCTAPRRLVITDVSTATEATLDVPSDSNQLVWRADGSGLAFSIDDPTTVTSDGAIMSVDVTHEIVAAGTLGSSPLVRSDPDCLVSNPAFGPGGRLWYTKACGGSTRIAATPTGSEEPVDIEMPATESRLLQSLAVNGRTGQVAVVLDTQVWVLDGAVPRPVLGDAGEPVTRIWGVVWPGR